MQQSVSTPKKKGLEFTQILHRLLCFLRYGRLMFILAALGALAGIILYAYSPPLYYSRSVLRWHVYGIPFHEGAETKDSGPSSYRYWMELKQRLEAAQLVKETAVRLGIAKPEEDISTVQSRLRQTRLQFRDDQTLLLEVTAFEPRVVRDYPATLLEVYHESEARLRKEYREKALQKYVTEVSELKTKIDEELHKKLSFEKTSDGVGLTAKQQQMLQLPSEIERCKEQVHRMDQIKDDFNRDGGKLDNIAKLSLLSSFEKEWREQEKPKTGQMVRKSGGESPVSSAAPQLNVGFVVKPQDEEGSNTWRTLEKELRSLQEDVRQQGQKYLPGHEVMKKLNERLDELNHRLTGEMDAAFNRFNLEYTRTKVRLPELEAQMPEYYEAVGKFEQFNKEYSLLAHGEADWNDAHSELSKRIAAMQFGDQKNQVEIMFAGYEILNDVTPISPNAHKSMLLGLALILALGMSLPLLLEYSDSTISEIPSLEKRIGLLGLGMVPLAPKQMIADVFRAPAIGSRLPNFLLECFRIIRSNIILHPGREGRSQIVAITSARPSEGKSTLASNLAWAFYSMGERTLLVDTDLRRGRVHNITGLPNERGLASYFAGDVTADQIVQKTKEQNFDVVTRGPFIPGASEYLCRDVFEKLVMQWRTKYDRIILDGPPVLGLSETAFLQRVADGVVVVVKAQSTKGADVEACVEQLHRSGTAFFGFVLNRLDLSKKSNHYYYYYYSPYYNTSEETNLTGEPMPQM